MPENPVNDETPEYRDYLGEALADHKAGPIKKSKFLAGLLGFSVVYSIGLLITILWRIFGSVDLMYAYFSFTVLLPSPIVGTIVFVIGYLRRYRYLLGKTVERAGLAVFILGWVCIVVLAVNPVR